MAKKIQAYVKLQVPAMLGFGGYLTLDSDVCCVGDFDSRTFVDDGRAILPRSGLSRLLQEISAGKIDMILVERLDDLSRDPIDLELLFNAFERVGRQVLSLASAERKLFPDLVDEALGVARLFEEASPPALRAALVAYHQRRMDAAPLLILEREADLLRPTDGGRA